MKVIEELREQYLGEIRAWDWGHIKAEIRSSAYDQLIAEDEVAPGQYMGRYSLERGPFPTFRRCASCKGTWHEASNDSTVCQKCMGAGPEEKFKHSIWLECLKEVAESQALFIRRDSFDPFSVFICGVVNTEEIFMQERLHGEYDAGYYPAMKGLSDSWMSIS